MKTKEIKTRAGWNKSGLTLTGYLNKGEPCEIDEEIFNYICECVAPNYLSKRNGVIINQGGDAHSSFESDENPGEMIFTYHTVMEINNKYYFLGTLPEFKE